MAYNISVEVGDSEMIRIGCALRVKSPTVTGYVAVDSVASTAIVVSKVSALLPQPAIVAVSANKKPAMPALVNLFISGSPCSSCESG